jgi:hypothetical protein
MTLKVDFRRFLDEEGNVLALTEQANTVFQFLSKIVSSVSQRSLSHETVSPNREPALIDVDLKCNSRSDALSCPGDIEASSITIGIIEWHCDTCKAAGTISNWQASKWDKQKRTMH